MLVGATAYRMLTIWPPHDVKEGDVVLVWGGSGGLGSMAIQIAKALGGIPIAVVSNDERGDYCMSLGAKGYINRTQFDHWGRLPDWPDDAAMPADDAGLPRLRQGDLGHPRRAQEPAHRLRAPRPGHDPDLALRLRHRRHGRHLRRHHRLQRRR